MIEEAAVSKVGVEIGSRDTHKKVVMGKEEERPAPPDWLDEAFMQEALRQGGHLNALLDDFEIGYAIAPGDNYSSLIYRVKLHFKGKSDPLVVLVKTLPAGEQWAKMVVQNQYFDREMVAFSRVLPAMDALLGEAAPGRFQPFAARCLHHAQQPSPFIVLQDLGPQGFRMADRRKGMDLPHALLALRALGRFHGASAALWRRRPELFEGLTNPFDQEMSERDLESFYKSFDDVANAVIKWKLPGEYDKKIFAMKATFHEKIRIISRERPDRHNVLIHGDFWSNNMLFSYDGETVKDVRFVDYQGSHMGSPAMDLLVFKYSSLQEEVLDNHWDLLLQAYADSMRHTLQTLGEDAPTLQDIRDDLIEARAFSFMVATLWLPIVRRQEGVYDIEKAVADGDWSGDSLDTPVFRYWMKKLLPTFLDDGVFD